MTHKVAIGLGSNLGDRPANLQGAIDLLQQNAIPDARMSGAIETAPVDCHGAAPDYINSAVVGHTKLTPDELHLECRRIEDVLGKPRQYTYHADRIIDIDILLYGEKIVDRADLQIPHPRMTDRLFVLSPLHELAAGWRIPPHNRTVAQHLAAVIAADKENLPTSPA